MTVSELIDLLRDCDPNSLVVDTHGDPIEEVDEQDDEGVVYIQR